MAQRRDPERVTGEKVFPRREPVGRSVGLNETAVVGIVWDVHQFSLETEPRAEAYVPIAQQRSPFGDLIVRTSDYPYQVLPAVKPCSACRRTCCFATYGRWRRYSRGASATSP